MVRFALDGDEDGTVVTVNPDYTVKYGAMGSIMDRMFMRRKVKKGMEGLLAGLKYHLETGEPVGESLPAVEKPPEPGSGVRWHRLSIFRWIAMLRIWPTPHCYMTITCFLPEVSEKI